MKLARHSIERLKWAAYVFALFAVAASTLLVELGMHAHSVAVVRPDTACSHIGQTQVIAVSAVALYPNNVTAHLCDQLIFHNATNGLIEIAMGPHDQHIAYPGLGDRVLGPGQEQKLLLVSKGTFTLHEHLRDRANGVLTVLP